MSYSVEGVLSSWSETTDYGQSFRAMNEEGQRTEVANLNKGAAKCMKGIIKNKLLIVHYKQLVAYKLSVTHDKEGDNKNKTREKEERKTRKRQ